MSSRQTLRTRKGCNRCKIRRKKCDEVQPVCGPCSRLQLACSWPQSPAERSQESPESDFHIDAALEAQGLIRRIPSSFNRPAVSPSRGYEAFRNDTEFFLTEKTPAILTSWLSPLAGPECHDLSMIFSLALREPWIRDALCAFSASMLSKQDARFHVMALRHYQTALSSLRDHFSDNLDENRRLALIVVMMLLGLFEALSTGDSNHALTHFTAAARLCSIDGKLPQGMSPSSLNVYRTAMEFSLYYIANLSIFHPDPQPLLQAIDWEAFESTFAHPTDPSMTNYTISPILGGHHEAYYMMVKVSCLARQTLSKEERESKVESYLEELEVSRLKLDTYQNSSLSDSALQENINALKIQNEAVHIFLLKILQPNCCSGHPAIRSRFSNWQMTLAELDPSSWFAKRTWHLFILLCAAHTNEDLLYIRDYASKLPDFLEYGNGDRFSRLLDVVIRWRSRGSFCTVERGAIACVGCHDGLDLLLLKDGIFSQPDPSTERT